MVECFLCCCVQDVWATVFYSFPNLNASSVAWEREEHSFLQLSSMSPPTNSSHCFRLSKSVADHRVRLSMLPAVDAMANMYLDQIATLLSQGDIPYTPFSQSMHVRAITTRWGSYSLGRHSLKVLPINARASHTCIKKICPSLSFPNDALQRTSNSHTYKQVMLRSSPLKHSPKLLPFIHSFISFTHMQLTIASDPPSLLTEDHPNALLLTHAYAYRKSGSIQHHESPNLRTEINSQTWMLKRVGAGARCGLGSCPEAMYKSSQSLFVNGVRVGVLAMEIGSFGKIDAFFSCRLERNCIVERRQG